MESPDAVTATSVELGVPELEAEMSTEIHGQLFMVLSALTDGEKLRRCDVSRRWPWLRELAQVRRWDPHTVGRARSLLREVLSPSRVKLTELMGAIERMEDLVRRYCGRRDVQGNVRSLVEDIRMSSFQALLPGDLEKHVQLNRARLIRMVS